MWLPSAAYTVLTWTLMLAFVFNCLPWVVRLIGIVAKDTLTALARLIFHLSRLASPPPAPAAANIAMIPHEVPAPSPPPVARRRRAKKKPLPAQGPPRPTDVGRCVRFLDGPYSRVRGEYYLDDDINDRALVERGRAHGLKILTSVAAGMGGADDLAHLKLATCRRMVLVTRDNGFIGRHERGVKHSGILHAPHGPEWID